MAGTGWLLLRGGLSVMTSEDVSITNLQVLAGWDSAPPWLLGLGLAVFIVATLGHRFSSILVGLAMLAMTLGIHAAARVWWSGGALEKTVGSSDRFPKAVRSHRSCPPMLLLPIGG